MSCTFPNQLKLVLKRKKYQKKGSEVNRSSYSIAHLFLILSRCFLTFTANTELTPWLYWTNISFRFRIWNCTFNFVFTWFIVFSNFLQNNIKLFFVIFMSIKKFEDWVFIWTVFPFQNQTLSFKRYLEW